MSAVSEVGVRVARAHAQMRAALPAVMVTREGRGIFGAVFSLASHLDMEQGVGVDVDHLFTKKTV